jgi:hypothetical protein
MPTLSLLPAYGCVLTSGLLIAIRPFRLRIGILAIQYVFVTWIIVNAVPLQLAATKLIAGLLTCGILALSALRANQRSQYSGDTGLKVVAVVLVALATPTLSQINWLGIPDLSRSAAIGSTALMILGFMHLGLSQAPLRAVTAMVTALSGFEIVYSLVEPSLVVFALLASVHIGLGMVASVLMLRIKRLQV